MTISRIPLSAPQSARDLRFAPTFSPCPWVQVHEAPTGIAWRLINLTYDDPEHSGGNHHIYVHLLRADGTPAGGIKVTHGWPNHDKPDETVTARTDPEGNVNWAMWENSNIDDRHPRGPYWIQPIEPADWVDGMGLPSKHHVNYRLTFQWEDLQEPPPPPDDGKEPDFWSAVRAISNTVPPAQFIIMPYGGHSYRVSRIGDGGLVAVEVERPGTYFLVTGEETLNA
jgi:hypothetical protein